MTPEEREALTEGVRRARRIAEPVGPMHGLWEAIFDAEAVLAGKPTLLVGDRERVVEECMRSFRSLPG